MNPAWRSSMVIIAVGAVGLAAWAISASPAFSRQPSTSQPAGSPTPRTRPTPVRALNSPVVRELLAGVEEISSPGDPGSLAVWGDDATPVVTGKLANARAPVVAAGTLGEGRFVAFAHTGYVNPVEFEKAHTRRLIGNAIRWVARLELDADGKPKGTPRVGLVANSPKSFDVGFPITLVSLGPKDWLSRADEVDVLVLGGGIDPTEEQTDQLGDIIRRGKGVLVAQTGWGWQQVHGGRPMYVHPFSHMLRDAGVSWTGERTEEDQPDRYIARNAPPGLLHAARAFEALVEHDAGRLKLDSAQLVQAVDSVTEAGKVIPADDQLLRPKLEKLRAEMRDKLVPSAEHPISTTKEPLRRALLAFDLMSMMQSPLKAAVAHPAAKVFPGEVPAAAARIDREVLVDTSIPGWHSTGLYAVPGEFIYYEVLPPLGQAEPVLPAGTNTLKLRYGCHRDELWSKDSWQRLPDIAFSYNLDQTANRHVTPFGGLLYIDVPDSPSVGVVRIRLRGAVEAPLFILGRTSPVEWREKLRLAPGPWGEIGTDKVIISVPSELLRKLDDPEEVLHVWDRILDAAADLAARPHERRQPERYVADVQISAGYMHSGYPIMTHLDAAPRMISAAALRQGQWGLFHELGHNHQEKSWTFNGTKEVTCNLFTLYILETVCGLKPSTGHDAFRDRERRMGLFFAKPLLERQAEWKRDPFIALFMYCQLREAFGWEPFKRVFADYRALVESERPTEDSDKRDQWLTRFSRAVGKDLGRFFEEWGVRTSQAARDSLKDLPEWLPENFPPK